MSQAALREKEIAEQQRQVADEQRQLAEQQQREAQLQSKAALQARDEMQVARKAAEESRVAADEARGRAETALYFNRVRLSYQYWLADNLSDSRRLLNECPLDRRGWEWRYLDRIHRADLLTLPGNGQFTNVLKFSSDGKRMAAYAYSGDRGVRIWDLTTNQPLSEITLVRTQRSFNCADLSPDGKTVALGDEAGAISLWNAETGQLIREFARLPKSVGSLSFSPDGKWLAAARAEGRNGEQLLPLTESPRNEDLVVWDVASGNEVFHPKGHGFTALFSPDSSRLLSFKMNTALRLHPAVPETFLALFDTAGWTEVATEKSGHVRSFSFSGDGKLLAIGGQDRQRDVHFVRVIDPATGNELANLTPRHLVGDIALSHRGESLAIASSLGPSQIDVWDVKQKRLAQVLRGHTSFVNGISFSPDGRLASCSWDNTIKFWNTTAGQQLTRIPGQVGLLADPVEFAPGGDLFAYGQRNTVSLLGSVRTVTLVDAATGKTRHTLAGHTGGANCLAFSADGARLVSGGRKGDVKVWDTKSGKSICSVRGGDGEICAAALSPDGRTFVTAHEPPEMTRARFGQGQFRQIPVAIKVWDADTGSQLAKLTGHPGGVFRLAFGPDGTVLASAGSGGIKYWDLATGTERRGLEPEILQSATSDLLLFNPTGDRLLTSGFNTLQVCDVATGRALTKIQGHRAFFLANGAAISPDQTRLATAWIDEVKLWDLATGQEILTLPLSDIVSAEKPRVAALQWTADGQQLRAVSPDGAVLTWDGSPRP
jgi:WD40 repeat protein